MPNESQYFLIRSNISACTGGRRLWEDGSVGRFKTAAADSQQMYERPWAEGCLGVKKGWGWGEGRDRSQLAQIRVSGRPKEAESPLRCDCLTRASEGQLMKYLDDNVAASQESVRV